MILEVTEDSIRDNVVFAKSMLLPQLQLHLSYFAKQDEESIVHIELLKDDRTAEYPANQTKSNPSNKNFEEQQHTPFRNHTHLVM